MRMQARKIHPHCLLHEIMAAFPQTRPFKWRLRLQRTCVRAVTCQDNVAAGPIFKPIVSSSDAGEGIRSQWSGCDDPGCPYHYFSEAQANSKSNTTSLLRLGATSMHEAVAEIAMPREMARLGLTLAVSTVDVLSRRMCAAACVRNLGSP